MIARLNTALRTTSILRVVLIYAGFAALWILASDWAVAAIFQDPEIIHVVSTVKGWLFVAITSALLYFLLSREPSGADESSAIISEIYQPSRFRLALVFALLAIFAITGLAVAAMFQEQKKKQLIRLELIADFESARVREWLDRRDRALKFLSANTPLSQLFQQWQQGDESASMLLRTQLIELARWNIFENVLVLDRSGAAILWDSSSNGGAQLAWDPRWSAAIERARASGQPQTLSPRLDESGQLLLDSVVVVPGKGAHDGAILVLRDDATADLMSLFTHAPLEIGAVDVAIVHRAGTQIEFLNRQTARPATVSIPRFEINQSQTLGAQAMRGDLAFGQVGKGVDYRGAPVVGIVRDLSAPDWLLVVKLDRKTLYEHATANTIWIALAGLLAALVTIATALVYRQRQQFLFVRREQQLQQEHLQSLQSLQLLKAITESSRDAIFAKDLDGRYLVFNNEVARITGTNAERVLGADDRVLFPAEQAELLLQTNRKIIAERATITLEERLSTINGERIFLTTKGPLFGADGEVFGTYGVSRDITEQKRIEAALRTSEARQQATVQALSEGVLVFDRQGQVVSCNPAAERILSVTGEALREMNRRLSDWQVLREDLSPCPADEIPVAITLRTGQPQRGVVLADLQLHSQLTWLLINCEPMLWDADGNVDMVVATLTDITAVKQASDALTLQNSILEKIAASNSFLGILQDLAELFAAKFPRVAVAITGVNQSGDHLDLLASSGLPEGARNLLKSTPIGEGKGASGTAAALGGPLPIWDIAADPYSADYRALPEQFGLFSWWSTPISDHDDRVIGTLDLFVNGNFEPDAKQQSRVDTLVRTLALAFMRERSEGLLRKLSLAVEQSPESIVITDLKGSIEYVNDTFVRVSGYSREELIGSNSSMLSSGRTPAGNYRALWDALAHGLNWKGEFYNRRKDGTEYIEFAFVAPIKQADGTMSHYVAVKEDITEKKRIGVELDSYRHHLEAIVDSRTKLLEAAQARAEAASKAKSAFLANMSHEIRTPMNAVIGLTELMQRDDPTPLQAERLRQMDMSARHLLTIINDVLDLSKIEADRMPVESTDFHLGSMLDYVRSIVAQQMLDRGLTMQVDVDDMPLWLRGDPTKLKQALLNYLSNAIKFTEHGSIALRVHLLERCQQDVLLRFEVEDTGIGIAPEIIPRLFQSFEQSDASINRKYGGTGLGLAITANLARLMGGETGVDSEPGRGSTFWFTAKLDVGNAEMMSSPAVTLKDTATSLRRRHAGKRILVAEDNDINQRITTQLLEVAGFVVDIAGNGRIAVDMAATNDYAIVLMDMQMPEMDGLEAARRIRQLPDKGELPILALTANVRIEDRRAAEAAGMNGFITKPISGQELYATLLKLLQGTGELIAAPLEDVAPEQPESVAIDREHAHLVMLRLVSLLEIGDMEANPLARTESHLLLSVMGPVGRQLLQNIENFDYEQARQKLRDFMSQMN